ncbi:MAG TPA: hypothetical protein VF510_17185 [Ktedonobacterales bacterium]
METRRQLLQSVRPAILSLSFLLLPMWRVAQTVSLLAVLAIGIDGCAAMPYTPAEPTVGIISEIAPHAVSMLSPDEGWAVGARQAEGLHYHDGRWTRVSIPVPTGNYTDTQYTGIAALAPNDVWAVSYNGGFFAHYDGTTWSVVSTNLPGDLALQGIAMVSATEGWAVGLSGFLHYTHGQWVDARNLLPPRPASLATYDSYPGMRGICMLTPTNGWVVGNAGAIWHYDGTSWQSVASPSLEKTVALFSVRMISANEGWAVGGTVELSVGDAAVIEHYVGGRWSVFSRPNASIWGSPGHPSLHAIAMVSASEGWAAGQRVQRDWAGSEAPLYNDVAHSLLLHYEGGRWTEVAVPNLLTIKEIALVAPGEGWAAADGGLLHLHDGIWTAVVS